MSTPPPPPPAASTHQPPSGRRSPAESPRSGRNEEEEAETMEVDGADCFDPPAPQQMRHFADVVRVVMVARNWLLSVQDERERAEREERERIQNANVAAVFHLQPIATPQPPTPSPDPQELNHVQETAIDQPPANNAVHAHAATSNGPSAATNGPAHPPNGQPASFRPPPPRRSFAQRVRELGDKIKKAPLESVDPTKSLYYYWTMIVYVGFLYNAAMCVIFVFDDTQGVFFNYWFCGNAFFDLVFLLDIFVNSKLNHMEDGMMVRGWRRLAKRYMRSRRFTLDVLSVLPTDLLLIANRHYSLVRANRLLKIPRVFDFVERTNIRTNYPNGFRIFHIVVTCAVIFHLNAALYFKISLLRGINSTDFGAWEFNYVKNADPVFADCDILLRDSDEQCGVDESRLPIDDRASYLNKLVDYWKSRSSVMHNSNFTKQYTLSIYWSSLTLTTSGQQPYPTADLHNYLEIFDTIVGVLVFAVIVGSVGNVVVTMNRDRAQVQQLMDGIKFYMFYRNVAADIQKRVLECISYIEKYGMIRDESEIMEAVPRRLQGELALHLHMETLKNVQLLEDCEPSILYELVLRLTMQMYGPNDFLCRYGDVAKEMYIVKSGHLEATDENGKKVAELREGATFGELSLLRVASSVRTNRRMRSLRSVGYSDVYQLRQEDVLEVLADYPEARTRLVKRVHEISRQGNPASGERDEEELNPGKPVEGFHSIDETLALLTASIKSIDQDLEQLYSSFQGASSENKRRITRLEAIYKNHRSHLPTMQTLALPLPLH